MRLGRAYGVGVIVAACAAAAIALTGCGASNVVDPVARAATVSNQTQGMQMAFTMRLTTAALPAPIVGSGSGTFDTPSRSGSVNLAMDFGNIPQVAQALGSSTLRMEEIIHGLNVYLKLPSAVNRGAAQGKPWIRINLGRAAQAAGIPGVSSLMSSPTSSDPSQFLRYLRAASGGVTKVGNESVDGFQTTHYKAQIDLDRVPNSFPASSRAQVRQAVTALERVANIHTLPVNVWIDGQHLVRRMAFAFNETVVGQPISADMRIDIPHYGPQPAPQLPPASQVTDVMNAAASSG